MGLEPAIYRPRDAEHTVLNQVISEHLETLLDAVAEAGDGAGLPQFVEREFRESLTCGAFEHGVARFCCEGCRREHLVTVGSGRSYCLSSLRHCPSRNPQEPDATGSQRDPRAADVAVLAGPRSAAGDMLPGTRR